MYKIFRFEKILFFVCLCFITTASSKENRLLTEYSPFLSRAYYNFNLGYVSYKFSDTYFNRGYFSNGRKKNRFSGRFLLGYKLSNSFALQFGVMRPAFWYEVKNVNGEVNKKSVWINLWSLSLKKNLQLSNRLGIYGELGIGNLTRVGFKFYEEVAYPDAHYATLVGGIGLQYKLSKKWDLLLNAMYLPESSKHNQPYVLQSTIGLQYNLKQIPRVEARNYRAANYFFPKRLIQIGYGSDGIGFFTNRFFSMNAKVGKVENFGLPIFWHGKSEAKNTLSVMYQKTAFRTEKLFSLDWGVSITGFQTVATNQNVLAVSIFPVLRFYLLRQKTFDFYVNYSIIGPAYLTKKDIDGLSTGPRITYQDFMGIGAFLGEKRAYNFDIKIMHYSNGNIFTDNAGVAIPLTFTVGKTF